MLIFPAIDLYEGQAVRLFKGDYQQMTVYDPEPLHTAERFRQLGASCIHLVDLQGARDGDTPNFATVREIAAKSGLFTEVGGGIRSMEVVERYLQAGVDRVILGTAAVTDPDFLQQAVAQYGEKIAVGVDIRDGYVAIRGWTEKSARNAFDFCEQLQKLGVSTLICTDISRDGAMQGSNQQLYSQLQQRFSMQLVASGGVSSLADVAALRRLNLYGAIIGKAYYTGAISLPDAIEVAK